MAWWENIWWYELIKIIKGQFMEDKFDGYGSFTWPNGIHYEGRNI